MKIQICEAGTPVFGNFNGVDKHLEVTDCLSVVLGDTTFTTQAGADRLRGTFVADQTARAAGGADPELLALIERIARRAEIMRLDAKSTGNDSLSRDAEEIRLLTVLAKNRLGVGDG